MFYETVPAAEFTQTLNLNFMDDQTNLKVMVIGLYRGARSIHGVLFT